jgi:lysophospholipase L1-like esterase
MDEGRLKAIDEQIGGGDFLFIQFGHNDEKTQDPTRYTEPFSTFMENLEIYINVARSHKAYPVLITPLERRCFVDEKHLGMGAHSDYVAAMKQTAEKNDVPLVDLYSMSRAALKKAGEKESRSWYMNFDKGLYKNYPDGKEDNTHLREKGAVMYAGLVAKGLSELGGIYADLIIDDVENFI